ncbi:Triacylglycerol lipase OS=Streptomyces fumanus OX=67302 GN=GCM10018772_18640 PE=3 SV=1 [Streptomyces fumanus]
MAADWCALGGKVSYDPVLLPSVGNSLLNHFGPLLSDQGDAISWLTDRLSAGSRPGPNCRALPLLP